MKKKKKKTIDLYELYYLIGMVAFFLLFIFVLLFSMYILDKIYLYPTKHKINVIVLIILAILCSISFLIQRIIKRKRDENRSKLENNTNSPSDRLIKRINRNGDVNEPETPRPLLTLEEFFTRNNDYGSIGCNLPDQPSPRSFYILFKKIRERPEVADVLVEISLHDDPKMWPFTDTIWIITSVTLYDVITWFPKRYCGDDYIEGFPDDKPMEKYDIPDGMRAIGMWWD
jgi:hypothetical protein